MAPRQVRLGSAPYGTVTLDDLDRHIVQLLRHDGRRSYADIARIVAASEPTVRKRVERLIRLGAISIDARVNPAALGLTTDAIIGIRVRRGTVQQVGARLAAMDNVSYVAYMTGGFDIFVEVFLSDTEALFQFLNVELAAIEDVTDAEAWHVLRTEKFSYTWEGEVSTEPSPLPTTVEPDGPADRDDETESAP